MLSKITVYLLPQVVDLSQPSGEETTQGGQITGGGAGGGASEQHGGAELFHLEGENNQGSGRDGFLGRVTPGVGMQCVGIFLTVHGTAFCAGTALVPKSASSTVAITRDLQCCTTSWRVSQAVHYTGFCPKNPPVCAIS